jgi:hypothetical protein
LHAGGPVAAPDGPRCGKGAASAARVEARSGCRTTPIRAVGPNGVRRRTTEAGEGESKRGAARCGTRARKRTRERRMSDELRIRSALQGARIWRRVGERDSHNPRRGGDRAQIVGAVRRAFSRLGHCRPRGLAGCGARLFLFCGCVIERGKRLCAIAHLEAAWLWRGRFWFGFSSAKRITAIFPYRHRYQFG